MTLSWAWARARARARAPGPGPAPGLGGTGPGPWASARARAPATGPGPGRLGEDSWLDGVGGAQPFVRAHMSRSQVLVSRLLGMFWCSFGVKVISYGLV